MVNIYNPITTFQIISQLFLKYYYNPVANMFTKDSIEQFYKDVESLSLRHPVKAIHEATKYNKGTVSLYLNRKDEPSENFLKAFYNKFGESLKNGTVRPTDAQHGTKSQNQGLDLIEKVSRLDDDQLRIMATLKVLISEIAPLIAKATGRSHANVSLQLEKDISEKIENLKTLRGRM